MRTIEVRDVRPAERQGVCPVCDFKNEHPVLDRGCMGCGFGHTEFFVGHGLQVSLTAGGIVRQWRRSDGPAWRVVAHCPSPAAAVAAFRLATLGEDRRTQEHCECARCTGRGVA